MLSDQTITIFSDLQRPSFAIVGSLYARAFEALGWRVCEVQTPASPRAQGRLVRKYPAGLYVHNTLGEGFRPVAGSVNIALPVHEWSRCPARWVRLLEGFDAVWVTTAHVAQALRGSGLGMEPSVVPPPLEGAAPAPVPHPRPAARPFRFLYVGEWHFRKGLHLLLDAFQQAFPEPGAAELTLKLGPECPWQSPREDITILKEQLAPARLERLYREHDCYVSASLGEGLGLPVAEAVLAGLPVAANRWGGHASLLAPGACFTIAHQEVPQVFASQPDTYADGQVCGFSAPAEIARVLREAASSAVAERESMAQAARAHLLAHYGREAALEGIRRALDIAVLGAGGRNQRLLSSALS